MAGRRTHGGDFFKIGWRGDGHASAEKFRCWVGGGTHEINVAYFQFSNRDNAAGDLFLVTADKDDITLDDGTARNPINLSGGDNLTDGRALWYEAYANKEMAASSYKVIGSYDLAANGDGFFQYVPKGIIRVPPTKMIGFYHGSYGASLYLQFSLWFTIGERAPTRTE